MQRGSETAHALESPNAYDPPSLPTLVRKGCVMLVLGVVGGRWGVGLGDGRSCGGGRVGNRWKCVSGWSGMVEGLCKVARG